MRSLLAVWRSAICESELGASAKLVAFVLSTFMKATGSTASDTVNGPSRQTIAAAASLSDRAIDAAIDALEDASWIEVLPRKVPMKVKRHTRGGVVVGEAMVMRRPGGKQASNTYVATLPPTANEFRCSEWERAKLAHVKSEAAALKSEAASHESLLKRPKASQCDECGLGGGHHADDCSRVAQGTPGVGYRHVGQRS